MMRLQLLLCVLYLASVKRTFFGLADAGSLGKGYELGNETTTCTIKDVCECVFENGLGINLRPLSTAKGKPSFVNLTDGSFYYSVNFCSDFNTKFCDKGAICQTMEDDSNGWVCGRTDGALFTEILANGSKLTFFRLEDGDQKRTSKILLVCDEKEKGKLEAFGDDGTLTYDFTLTSKYACPMSLSSSGISIGSILLVMSGLSLVLAKLLSFSSVDSLPHSFHTSLLVSLC
eukprot:m.2851 g.2851  ORF g.2851 m.2851 type:complete len:231 (+) comp8939_c0_seq1:26-718(+)